MNQLRTTIWDRWQTLPEGAVKSNLNGIRTGSNFLVVGLILNTPETRKAFRQQLIDSPLLRFEGTEYPKPQAEVGITDTLGIRLQPEFSVYSTQATHASFVLLNYSNHEIVCGEHYSITYEDQQGIWRELPIHDSFIDLGYSVLPGQHHIYRAALYPEIHPNRPGRYRFFYEITLRDTRTSLRMMTEFRLSNRPKEWKQARKLEISEQVHSQNTHRHPSATDTPVPDEHVYAVVEVMPEFEGGIKKLMEHIQNEMRYPESARQQGIQGRVLVQFVVEKDGSLSTPEIVRKAHPSLNAEAIRIIQQLPRWKPGKLRGQVKRVSYCVPIVFRLPTHP